MHAARSSSPSAADDAHVDGAEKDADSKKKKKHKCVVFGVENFSHLLISINVVCGSGGSHSLAMLCSLDQLHQLPRDHSSVDWGRYVVCLWTQGIRTNAAINTLLCLAAQAGKTRSTRRRTSGSARPGESLVQDQGPRGQGPARHLVQGQGLVPGLAPASGPHHGRPCVWLERRETLHEPLTLLIGEAMCWEDFQLLHYSLYAVMQRLLCSLVGD